MQRETVGLNGRTENDSMAKQLALSAQEAYLVDMVKLCDESRKAGDLELANAVLAHVHDVRRIPGLTSGNITLVLNSGRRVPLRDARKFIRRGGRNGTTSAAPGSLLAMIQQAGARCRKFRSEIDREKIAAVLSDMSGTRRAESESDELPISDDPFEAAFPFGGDE